MGTQKSAALDQTPVTIAGQPKPASVRKAKNAKTPPEKFTYALKDYTAERRKSGGGSAALGR